MKKSIRKWVLLLAIALITASVFACAGCSGEAENHVPEGYNEKLPAEIAQEVKDAWLAEKGHELVSYKYYGTYGECIVLFQATMQQAVTTKNIGGEAFTYQTSFSLSAYYIGTIMTLEEAYEKGLLSKSQIALIAEHHRKATG